MHCTVLFYSACRIKDNFADLFPVLVLELMSPEMGKPYKVFVKLTKKSYHSILYIC